MVPPNDSVDLVLCGGVWLRDTNQLVDCLGVCSDRSQLGFEGYGTAWSAHLLTSGV